MFAECEAMLADIGYLSKSAMEDAMRQGVAALDRILPDWRRWVDPDTLDMSSATHCVLGQIFGHHGRACRRYDDLSSYAFDGPSPFLWDGFHASWAREVADVPKVYWFKGPRRWLRDMRRKVSR